MITLQEIATRKELKRFVKFPFSLYKNHPYWVPPIIKDEVDDFDKNINPVFEHATARFFLAYKNGKIAGRIVAIINNYEVEKQKIRKMRFGWFDVIDDIEVTKALLDKVHEIGKENNLEFIEGPVGFSNLDKVGLLTDGYDHLATMISWYNYPYYVKHLEELGFKKEKNFDESYFRADNIDITGYRKISGILKKRYQLQPMNFTSSKEIIPYAEEMFDVFHVAYSKLSSYVPISKKQIEFFKKKFLTLLDPEFVKFVLDKDGKIVAFAITMPCFAKALQKAKGKLFPFGIFHLLKARKTSDAVLFYLIGVLPEYQKKGVTAIIFDEYHKTYQARGIKYALRSAELVDNKDIHLLWKNFNPVTHKKRSTFRKEIEY